MDTNVKKFKFSLPGKILCALLCIVTFAGAVFCGFTGFVSTAYFIENEDCKDWKDTETVYYDFYNDVCDALNGATYSERVAEAEKIVESKRESAISKFEQDYIDEYIRQMSNGSEYVDMYPFLDSNVPIQFIFDAHGMWHIDFNPNIPANTTPQAIRSVLETAFDNRDNFSYSQHDAYSMINNTGFLYYIEYNGKTYGDETVPDKLTSAEISYSLEGGQVLTKGISAELQNSIADQLLQFGIDKNEITVKCCVEFERSDSLLNAIRKVENKYLQQKELHTLAEKVYDSIVLYAVAAFVLLITSFICGITFIKVTGRNGEGEEAKLSFIDYMPFELHFVLNAAIGFGLVYLVWCIFDYFYLFTVTAIGMVTVLSAVVQMLILEFATSLSRAIGSKRKTKKFFLAFWAALGLIGILGLIKRLFKKIKRKLKNTLKPFSYKAKHFSKLFILQIALFYIINLAMLSLLVYLMNEWWITTFSFVLYLIFMVAVNFLYLRKAVIYVKNLDKIIVASGERKEPDLDIDKLHLSLKILAENMRYSNTELQTAIAKAVKDERLRAELITNVSHDLKTPLTSIISYVDLLSKCEINDPKALEYIKVLDDKGAKLKRLIDDLIEASKVTSGNISLDITTLNLSELCLQSTTEAMQDFEKNMLELIVKQGEKPTFVLADGAKTYRVVENLLSNARKYSAKRSRVYVSVYEEYGRGVFEIKNISEKPLDITPDELTERFVRGDESRNTDGNGLGLSIAKELCKAQNGELELTIDGDLFKARVILPRG